ncbi:hypothetical protein [Actinomadura sp. WMMB 499]|uniref:WD40/YVTN/BNR-like repeat-containing protein n=1 Tax=Actinomadura sp. WMMB 499 TaxID=1219491 RepID=UPI0012472AB6|nr:hypothetical protein [Actinomadura sp. WMMB 499]QFG25338.1 hypothetical protein F7P10_33500 [Actinomadura sp. WMMB 499]
MRRSFIGLALAASLVVAGVPGTARAAETGWGAVPLPFLWPDAALSEVVPDGEGGVWVGGHQGAYCVPVVIIGCVARSDGNPVVRRRTGTSWTEYPINGWTGTGPINRIASAAGETWIAEIGIWWETDFLARFDGSAFQKVELPPGFQLDAVGTGTGGTWIAGFTDDEQEPRLFRRTGGTWTAVDLPTGMVKVTHLQASRDGTTMWAAGLGPSAVRAAARFDGTSWTSVPPAPVVNAFSAIVPLAGDDVWAATATALVHWDGHAWTDFPFPDDYPLRGYFEDLAVDTSGTVWVTGGDRWLHRYRDGAWTRVEFGPSYGLVLSGLTTVPETNTVWAVGREGSGALAFTTP